MLTCYCSIILKCLDSLTGLRTYQTPTMFVPRHRPLKKSDTDCFIHFINSYNKIVALTGAGISTESGIPDYRSEEVGLYARSNHKPMQYQEFLKSAHARKKYWARNFLGWARMEALRPNISHLALSDLGDKIRLVTQNVDGLHTLAGSKNVVELHGSAHRVVCLNCGDITERKVLQKRLTLENKEIEVKIGSIRPDGDVDINEDQVAKFKLVDCSKCSGILKPDIVFFGDNVPAARVQQVAQWVNESEALLVVGSSLSVFSSYRVILQAHSLKKYIFIINIGPTRGDDFANIKLNVRASELLRSFKANG